MLLANIFSAEKLVSKCKEFSLLRKHEFPKNEKLERFNKACKKFGGPQFESTKFN